MEDIEGTFCIFLISYHVEIKVGPALDYFNFWHISSPKHVEKEPRANFRKIQTRL
jgi:hypothetical protein